MTDEFLIDLNRPPEDRWIFDNAQREDALQLAHVYLRDLGIDDDTIEVLGGMAKSIMPKNYWQEIEAISSRLDIRPSRMFVCNAYYDLVKSVLGCTAFAVDTKNGPIHARNLDWWTQNNLLNNTSFACRFVGAPAGEFVSVGWPGFTGVLSGMAPGRFSITLNAVLSNEPIQIAMPVSYFIRSVFETAPSFEAAVEALSNTVIPSDCLLLVTGTRAGEMVVIERSPTQHALRYSKNESSIAVANEYLVLDDGFEKSNDTELRATSSGRYGRIIELLRDPPQSLNTCIQYLGDPSVQMEITVQQMAFCSQSGEYTWLKT